MNSGGPSAPITIAQWPWWATWWWWQHRSTPLWHLGLYRLQRRTTGVRLLPSVCVGAATRSPTSQLPLAHHLATVAAEVVRAASYPKSAKLWLRSMPQSAG